MVSQLLEVFEILKILYSPAKTFKKISENSSLKRPILILALTLLLVSVVQYAYTSKMLIQKYVLDYTLIPSRDPLVIPLNKTFAHDAYRLSIYTFNWTDGSDIVIVNGTNNENKDAIEEVIIKSNNKAYYTNESYVKVDVISFSRAGDNESAYIILGELPEEYLLLGSTVLFWGYIFRALMNQTIDFLVAWATYVIIVWALLKLLNEEIDRTWIELAGTLGCIFTFLMIYHIINIIVILLLPQLKLPINVWYPPPIISEEDAQSTVELVKAVYSPWSTNLIYQAWTYMPLIRDIYIATYCIIALYSSFGIPKRKSLMISVVAFVTNFFIT